MKKIALATMIALAATTASALEMGVTAARDYSGKDRNGFGLFVGDRAGKGAVQFGIEQFTKGANDQNRFTALGSYDLTTMGPVTLAAKGGVAYLDNQTTKDGFAAVVGVSAAYAINKTASLTVDLAHQKGQARVNQFDGNMLTAGIRVKF